LTCKRDVAQYKANTMVGEGREIVDRASGVWNVLRMRALFLANIEVFPWFLISTSSHLCSLVL